MSVVQFQSAHQKIVNLLVEYDQLNKADLRAQIKNPNAVDHTFTRRCQLLDQANQLSEKYFKTNYRYIPAYEEAFGHKFPS